MSLAEQNSKQWFALYTKPRWEKKIHTLLTKKGLQSWCPLQKVERQWSDRRKIVEMPLFKSYVFVHIDSSERVDVLRTDGVLNFVFYLGQPAVIRDEEIDLIKSYLAEEDVRISITSTMELTPDTLVKIKQGVFMDREGKVLARSGKRKVYVELQSLGQMMIVEFPADHIQRIMN